jgi:transcriptional regulator with XRE-family HTH domain
VSGPGYSLVVNFDVVKKRLIRFVSLRIRNGVCTQRQLAKLVGVSQPQLHNVLKGVRALNGELADALLAHFEISLIDLLEPGDYSSPTALPKQWSDAPMARRGQGSARFSAGRTESAQIGRAFGGTVRTLITGVQAELSARPSDH